MKRREFSPNTNALARPRTFPVFRLIKCNRVQALHMTASYSL
jgi:hypothetical protein